MSEGGQSGVSREMTFGEKAVGIAFNPSADNAVDEAKRKYAELIDDLNQLRTDA